MSDPTLVHGVDFTSAPGRGKPITVASARFDGATLSLERLDAIPDLDRFARFLEECPGRIVALDFPFGLPRSAVEWLGWPVTWPSCLEAIGQMGRAGYEAALEAFRIAQPPGQKRPQRRTDARTGGTSPVALHVVPVAKMLFEGATRLHASGIDVPPCRRRPGASRVALEGYPALVARALIGRRSYKGTRGDPDRLAARRDLLDRLREPNGTIPQTYGCRITMTDEHVEVCAVDHQGDRLDAVLCAVQAAWAALQGPPDFGVPTHADPLEGWIIDPLPRT